ncbi:MAG: hypothetical protein INQ03_25485 [Candidatus Heimdallarchaeota archaeon]|nr:hypothetical protein [Candidatus Heimdallarchaeota archaeon]
MLEIQEPRRGVLEFKDSYIRKSRQRRAFLISLLKYLFIITLIVLVIGIFVSFPLPVILLLVLGLLLFPVLYVKVRQSLIEEIQGFQISIDNNRVVTNMKVQTWIRYSASTYILDDVRYNQTVGFTAIMGNNGIIELVIIVDRNYPGEVIYRTSSVETLMELRKCFSLIFPDKTEWYTEGEWMEEELELMEEEMSYQQIPLILREYYPLQ